MPQLLHDALARVLPPGSPDYFLLERLSPRIRSLKLMNDTIPFTSIQRRMQAPTLLPESLFMSVLRTLIEDKVVPGPGSASMQRDCALAFTPAHTVCYHTLFTRVKQVGLQPDQYKLYWCSWTTKLLIVLMMLTTPSVIGHSMWQLQLDPHGRLKEQLPAKPYLFPLSLIPFIPLFEGRIMPHLPPNDAREGIAEGDTSTWVNDSVQHWLIPAASPPPPAKRETTIVAFALWLVMMAMQRLKADDVNELNHVMHCLLDKDTEPTDHPISSELYRVLLRGPKQVGGVDAVLKRWCQHMPRMPQEPWIPCSDDKQVVCTPLHPWEAGAGRYHLPPAFITQAVWRPGVWQGGIPVAGDGSVMTQSAVPLTQRWLHDNHPIHPWLRTYLQRCFAAYKDSLDLRFKHFVQTLGSQQQQPSKPVLDLDLDMVSSDEENE
jgi:hypothetical protein